MACEQHTEAILESVGAEAPPPEVQAHLDGCAACRRLAAQTLQALQLIDALPDAPVPAGFAPRTLARARAERRGQRSMWLSAAAAALIVVTGGLIAVGFGGDPEPAGDRNGPVDVASDRPDPGTDHPTVDPAAAPPDAVLENFELLENFDLLREFKVIEALDPVEARDRYRELD